MNLSDKINKIWNNAENCGCDVNDCEYNHKLCGICNKTIIYGAHESQQPNSDYAWNVDHIIPRSKKGTNSIKNLQAVHIYCNEEKKDY